MPKDTNVQSQADIDYPLFKDFFRHSLLAVAFIIAGFVVLFILFFMRINFLPFNSFNGGLSDHFEYLEKLATIIGLVMYTAYLIYERIKGTIETTLVWILVIIVQLSLLVLSLVSKHAPPPYGDYAVWEPIVFVVLMLGYGLVSVGRLLRD